MPSPGSKSKLNFEFKPIAGGIPKVLNSPSGSAVGLINSSARSVADDAAIPVESPRSVSTDLAGSELNSDALSGSTVLEIMPARTAG